MTNQQEKTRPASPLLSLPEAAAYLHVAEQTMYTWRSRRRGEGPPAVKIGNRVKYRLTDLDAFIEQAAQRDADRTNR